MVGDDRWWLGDRADRDSAAVPLADRVEWAVYSLLSTAGPLSEDAVHRADRRPVHRPRPAGRGARPGLPRELSQPVQHAGPPRHDRRRRQAQPRARRADRGSRGPRAPARVLVLDRRAAAAPPPGRRAARRPPGRPRARGTALPRPDRRRGPRGGRCHLVRPRSGRVPVGGRVDGDAGRARAPPARTDPPRRSARPVPRRAAGAGGARPPQAGALAAPAPGARGGRLAPAQGEPPPGVGAPRPVELADLEALLGLDPAVERTGDQLSLFAG